MFEFLFPRSTAALKSYEKQLKEEKGVAVELLSFSEQSELDAEKLKRKLDETSQSSQVSVLLLLTGASSYLWFDTQHHPRNVELCTMLKQRFPETLRFVICPTSKTTRDEWVAHKPQLGPIFGDFFRGSNVSVWDGFDRDAESVSPICSLIRKESSETRRDIVRGVPAAWKSSIWPWGVCAISGLGILYLWLDRSRLRTALEASQIKNQKLQSDLNAALARLAPKESPESRFLFFLWAPNYLKNLIPDWLQALVESWLPSDS